MTMTKTKPSEIKLTITIIDDRRFRAAQRTVSIAVGFILPITLGAVLQSQAMQWFGFLFGLIMMTGYIRNFADKYRVTNIEDARTLLDKIERGET